MTANFEEVEVNRDSIVPFHLQNEIKQRGAIYSARRIPFTTHVEVDGRIITGQNPQSASQVGREVKALLK